MALWGKTDTLASAPKYEKHDITFDATAAGNFSFGDDKFKLSNHRFVTGDRVTYTKGAGGTALNNVADNGEFFVGTVDADTFILYNTKANALTNDGSTGAINITAVASGGTVHNLEKSPDDIFFVDTTEAGIAANIAKGLKTPGWNKYSTSTRGGVTRHDVEVLIPMKVAAGDAGDLGLTGTTGDEDSTVADA
jgi:hypothetical protein